MKENETAIALQCVHPVRELAARCDPEKMGTVDFPGTGNTSSSEYVLRLVPSNELTVGLHQFAVRVTAMTPDNQEAAVRIPAIVHVVDDLVFSPAVLHFGYVSVGSEAVSKTVALRSRLNKEFAVASIECDASSVQAAMLGGDDSDRKTRLHVSLRADQSGSQGATVRIAVRYPERQGTTYRNIRVLYTGMPSAKQHP